MSECTLPVHPVSGLRAIGFTSRGPIWPVMGGSGESDAGGESGGSSTGPETGTGDHGGSEQQETETVDWKKQAREWEKRAKANSSAAEKLAKLEDEQKSEAQRAADAKAAAEAEIAGVPAKVAQGLRDHLVKLHKISDEDSELFLTAADPELLLKQVARLVGGASDKSKKNSAPREGRSSQRPGEDATRSAVRQLFNS